MIGAQKRGLRLWESGPFVEEDVLYPKPCKVASLFIIYFMYHFGTVPNTIAYSYSLVGWGKLGTVLLAAYGSHPRAGVFFIQLFMGQYQYN